jgi:DNA-binding FadR family transcriptional regulator
MIRPEPEEWLSRAQQVANQIEDEILAARLPVGAHLGRRVEHMNRFGISPTVMSEVMRILQIRGLVNVRRGTGGGLFVASRPPQIRLGAMDLWFQDNATNPLDLFEARVHLEAPLTAAAFERANHTDHIAMQAWVDKLEAANSARSYLEAVMRLHRAIATASHISVLDGMHQALVATITANLSRAEFVENHQDMLHHSIDVHRELVDTIILRDPVRFAKVSQLHNEDLVRADDPNRSPRPPSNRRTTRSANTRVAR